jgi:predicted ATPase
LWDSFLVSRGLVWKGNAGSRGGVVADAVGGSGSVRECKSSDDECFVHLVFFWSRWAGESRTKRVERTRPVLLVVSGTRADVGRPNGQEPLHYHYELGPRGTGYAIALEELAWKRKPEARQPHFFIKARHEDVHYADLGGPETSQPPSLYYDFQELALAQVASMFGKSEEPEALRSTLSKTRFFGPLDVGQRAIVRLPQSLTPAQLPGPNGENLYAVLYNLRTSHADSYAQIEEVLKIGFAGFRRLEFPVVATGQVTMAWHQDPLTGPLYPNELSEGTLRFLWLATILLSPAMPSILLIDEPEVSLHPELLKLLAGLLQDAATCQQVIVATHSPDLVHWLQPEEVLILEKEEGRTLVTWADDLDLDEWLKEYTLRDLWLMGTLGGRP